MKPVDIHELKALYVPPPDSHKGQNGKLLLIGGSHLFHAASLWALTVASRIVDLVHYSSVPENNELVTRAKEEFRNGIVVTRSELTNYIEEDDCILIGVGMTRDSETEELTNSLLKKYPHKQWVIDAGSLQMMDVSLIPKNAILTPHHQEFDLLFDRFLAVPKNAEMYTSKIVRSDDELSYVFYMDQAKLVAKTYSCIVLLKGKTDIICLPNGDIQKVEGGNAGMTKGGTGDVLSGLVAALACKNDPFLSAIAGSVINKRAGDMLYKTVGSYYNSTDLANQIPVVMKELIG